MPWERIKNYLLLFLVLLNLILAGFMWNEYRRYTVTTEQERVIREVLNRHNVQLYNDMLRRFPPMRPLTITAHYYDVAMMLNIFFDDPQLVTQVDARYLDEFYLGEVRLTIEQGFVIYENPNGLGMTVQQFIDRHFPTFVLDTRFYEGNDLHLVYRQQYRGYLVYTNIIEFIIAPNGATEVEMQFGRIEGFADAPVPIFAPDEALLTFLQRIVNLEPGVPQFIDDMDIVYFQEITDGEPGTTSQAMPFYRIFVRGFDMPFLINARTNEMMA